MAVTLGVRTSEESPPTAVSSREGGSPWIKYAFVATPIILSVVGLISFSSRNLREAYAEMMAEISAGSSDYARLRGVGQASKDGSARMADHEYDRIVTAAKLTADQIVKSAEIQGEALVNKEIALAVVPRNIANGFTMELYGRTPEIAGLCFEVAKLKVGLANQVDFSGDVETLAVAEFWPESRKAAIRALRIERFNEIQTQLDALEETAMRDGATGILSLQGRRR